MSSTSTDPFIMCEHSNLLLLPNLCRGEVSLKFTLIIQAYQQRADPDRTQSNAAVSTMNLTYTALEWNLGLHGEKPEYKCEIWCSHSGNYGDYCLLPSEMLMIYQTTRHQIMEDRLFQNIIVWGMAQLWSFY